MKAAGDWGSINNQRRLAIPAEVTDCLSWYEPNKEYIDVSIDLSKPGMITIRNLKDVEHILDTQRQLILKESEDAVMAGRRIAMTHHFFRRGTLIVSARRLGLKAVILDHLEAAEGDRLFCLGFENRVEAYNKQTARNLMLECEDEISLESTNSAADGVG